MKSIRLGHPPSKQQLRNTPMNPTVILIASRVNVNDAASGHNPRLEYWGENRDPLVAGTVLVPVPGRN
ncbi:hypothetical protein ACFU90_23195 [Streptomyces noursei]|uniref:hypothetical protein n=1 Tax=Streptomyces noursei TaxID=1971 RepID=UPI000B22A51C|nr:hypothetical protein [Streptomyces noursei]